MPLQTLRSALTRIESDPDEASVWQALEEVLSHTGADAGGPLRMLTTARHEHLKRREWGAVARLLDREARLANDTADALDRLRQEAKVQRDNLLNEESACRIFDKILELAPDDLEALQALDDSRAKRKGWRQLKATYLKEAKGAPDDLYRSSMLMRAAEVELRFSGAGAELEPIVDGLKEALRLDPTNERAAELLELIHRRRGDYPAVVAVLERVTRNADNRATCAAAATRAARICRHRLDDALGAATYYQQVLSLVPANAEALDFLADHYAGSERWDELVEVYEASLSAADGSMRERTKDIHRVASLLWRKRGNVDAAKPWFSRLSKVAPAHPDVLEYYRQLYAGPSCAAQLISVLSAAQRVLPPGDEKQAITAEIAGLAIRHADPHKAIEQYKHLLRQDPDNERSIAELKVLYRQTGNFRPLVELLRQQLERLPAQETPARVAVLHEVAELYRGELSNDTALVGVLSQLIQLDPDDAQVARELTQSYEKLGRWRDLLTSQQRLAALTQDQDEKVALLRAAGRRWLEQFSNVQNATTAYEGVLALLPSDAEARARLRELYHKRRAWPALFALYQSELADSEGQARVDLLREMGRLAAERLGRAEEASKIYRELLSLVPSDIETLTALERQAERGKDWDSLADALERRIELEDNVPRKIALLQKLGQVHIEHRDDAAAAEATFLRVLDVSPRHARALRILREGYIKRQNYQGLQALYERLDDYEGLAEVLSNAADRSAEPAQRIDLSYRAAEIYEQRLQQPARAFRCYERVLAADAADLRAARALIPIYEADEKWARLPPLYELCLEAAESVADKTHFLDKLINLSGARIVDRARSLQYARAAFELSPNDLATLEQFEQAARAARDYMPLCEAISKRLTQLGVAGLPGSDVAESAAPGSVEPGVVRELRVRLALVCDEHLERTDDAVALLRAVVQENPKDVQAVASLERILRRDGRREELRDLFDVKLEQADAADQRISMLSDWANLEQGEFDSAERAADLYRRILQVEPGRLSAVRTLPKLLMSLERPKDAAEAIEDQLSNVSNSEKTELELQLGEIYLGELAQADRALATVSKTLDRQPQEARALALMQRLMERGDTRRDAAAVLADTYSRSGDSKREAEALEAALEVIDEPAERKQVVTRLVGVYENKRESVGAAFEVALRAARDCPDDLQLWDEAERLGLASGRVTDLSEAFRETLGGELEASVAFPLCDRAARLHEEILADPLGAVSYLERMLGERADNQAAFFRLKQILTSAEQWAELEALYARAIRNVEDVPTRIELLAEVALVCEEIIEDDPKATRYYEQVVELQPGHELSLAALDRLYQRTGHHAELADLLEGRLETLEGELLLETELRLARLQLEKLNQPEAAIGRIERVLESRPTDYDARHLAEQMLELGEYRVRAARALEPVYEQKDEVRELVRVLEYVWQDSVQEAESSESEGSVAPDLSLLRRIAVLKDERLRDDRGALDALCELVPQAPQDVDARTRLEVIGLRAGEAERVADVLEGAAARAEPGPEQGEILMRAADICVENLGDSERSETLFRKVLSTRDPELGPTAARALSELYETSRRFGSLVEMLEIRVELSVDPNERAELLGRVGELAESQLGEPQQAIEAFKRRLDELPGDAAALEALDRLYDSTQQHEKLVSIVEQRVRQTTDPEQREALLRRQAQTLDEHLGDAAGATQVWREVRAEFGDQSDVLGALEALHRRSEQWDELAETYEAHLQQTRELGDRLRMLTALGDLRAGALAQPAGALDAYREALGLEFTYAPARVALERLLESEDPITRREAAEVLEPVFESDGDEQRLLKVIELQVEGAEDPQERLNLLSKAASIAEGALNNPDRVLGYVGTALRHGSGHVDLRPWLERLDKVCAQTGRRGEQVALLREIVPEIFEGDLQFSVTLTIACLARDELNDVAVAREYFEKALEIQIDAREPMVALEKIYESEGDESRLLSILERRADLAQDDEERQSLILRSAGLLARPEGDAERAIDLYERALLLGSSSQATEALEALYQGAERWEELIELYVRQLSDEGAAEETLRVKIARASARELQDYPQAFESLEAALHVQPLSAAACLELEHILEGAPEGGIEARAAELLEPIYLARGDFDRVMFTLERRLAHATETDDRRQLLSRLAKLQEEQKEDFKAALGVYAQLLEEDVGDEGTLSELERLARVAGDELTLGRIYADCLTRRPIDEAATAHLARRSGQIFAAHDQVAEAISHYRRALNFDPGDQVAFSELEGLLQRCERHEERVELLSEALDHRYDDADRLGLLERRAQLEREHLKLPDRAIATYHQALEIEPLHSGSLVALSEIYQELGRFGELAALYHRQADAARSPEEEAKYRLALAAVLNQELEDPDAAVDQLDEIVQSLPAHEEAIGALERLRREGVLRERIVGILLPLYEAADDWRNIIRMNEDRFELATDSTEKVAVLRETARLWRSRGEDSVKARRGLAIAFELEPSDIDVRAEYESLVEETEAWDELAQVYQARLNAGIDGERLEILATLARVHDEQRNDPRRALSSYQELIEEDEGNELALSKLEQLATMLSDWSTVVQALRTKTELVHDAEQRASLWRRVAEIRRDMLEQPELAVEAYERALELDPQSGFTLDNLIELYEDSGDPARLIELYQRRVELADDDDSALRFDLLCSAGKLYEQQLSDRLNAIDMYNQALSNRPGNPEVLAKVNSLYASEQLWPELLENLKFCENSVSDPVERRAVRCRIGQVLSEHLSEYEAALGSYRDVLEEEPDNAVAIAAVRGIGEDQPELRGEVAALLIPALSSQGRHRDLIAALEMQLSADHASETRAEILTRIADVYEKSLHDNAASLEAVLRALVETPDAETIHVELERLSGRIGDFSRYADSLAERAHSTFDPELARRLLAKLGRIREDELHDTLGAIEAYEEALRQAGDEPALLEALDRLYTASGDQESLAETLERRSMLTVGEGEQAELAYRLASVQVTHLGDSSRALISLRRALDCVPGHAASVELLEKLSAEPDSFEEVLEVLENVYRGMGQPQKVASLYERRVQATRDGVERLEAQRAYSQVLEEEAGDAERAQQVLQTALAEQPYETVLLGELERLASVTGNFGGAADAMEEALQKVVSSEPATAGELSLCLAKLRHQRLDDSLGAEQALLTALRAAPESDELLERLEELQTVPGRELALVETLRRRGKVALDPVARQGSFERAADLARRHGSVQLLESLLRELLAEDEHNAWALMQLGEVRLRAGDAAEAVALLERQIPLAAGPEARALRFEAAELAATAAKNPARAADLLNGALLEDPLDHEAYTRLGELYRRTQRHQDLAALLERQIEVTDDAQSRIARRLDLSDVQMKKLGNNEAAIEQLNAVLDEAPGHTAAVSVLGDLYERQGRDEELADLLERQVDAAAMAGDEAAMSALLVRLADILEKKVHDPIRAIEAYQRVVDLDPSQTRAVERLAGLLTREGRLEDAAQCYEVLLAEATSAESTQELAEVLVDLYAQLAQPERATQLIEDLRKQSRASKNLESRLARLYEEQHNWEPLAALHIQAANTVESTEQRVERLSLAAEIYAERLEEPDAAADLLSRAAELRPGDRALLLRLCSLLQAAGQIESLAETLQRVVQSYGGRRSRELGEVHRRLAGAYRALGDDARAFAELDHAFRTEPGNVGVLNELGQLALELGELKKAQQMYRALLLQRLDSASPISKAEVFCALGKVHQQLGEPAKARQMLERALQTNSALGEARELLRSIG